jgi:hypothetical protein
MRDGDDHVFALDQGFNVGLEFGVDEFGAARRAEFFFHVFQFSDENIKQFFTAAEDGKDIRRSGR